MLKLKCQRGLSVLKLKLKLKIFKEWRAKSSSVFERLKVQKIEIEVNKWKITQNILVVLQEYFIKNKCWHTQNAS